MQHGIGRPAERGDDGDCVFERLTSHDVTGFDVFLDQVQHGFASLKAIVLFLLRYRLLRRTVGETHAERFDRRRHRVGRVHAAARPWPRNRRLLDFE
jgi:hypothetical protein